MKNVKFIIIGVACICLICLGFYSFTKDRETVEKDLTEVEKIILKDLDEKYPKTPREVVKLYTKINSCYYGEELSDDELDKLVDQTLLLLDEELRAENPRDQFYDSIVIEIKKSQSENITVVSTDVCDTNEVKYIDDKKGDGTVDKLAYVKANYFVNYDGTFVYSYKEFVLRQDEDGRWKILTFYDIEGEPLED